MNTLYLNPCSGIAGDMFVGALLDAGADTEAFWQQLRSLPIPAGDEWAVSVEKTVRRGITASKFHVHWKTAEHDHEGHHHHAHRGLREIRQIIDGASLSEGARERCLAIFQALAEAEAAVHGCTPEEIHFHEVGAIDAISDIAGAAIALEVLQIERVICAPIAVGSGTVRCAHGVLPVPPPAVAMLLKGAPTIVGTADGELTTPTGAAILATSVTEYAARAQGTVQAVGYGAGTKDFPHHANVLQAMVLTTSDDTTQAEEGVIVIECNLDDMPGNRLTHVIPMLMAGGALDVTATPCLMKKGRQGMILQVLGRTEDREALADLLLRQTPTFGVRCYSAERTILRREIREVETAFGPVEVKFGYHPQTKELLRGVPEYESCRAIAEAAGHSFEEVYGAAQAAAARRHATN